MAHPQAPIRFENCNRSIYPHPQQLAADADNQQQHQQASVGIVGGNHAQIPQAVSVEHHQHIHQSSQDRQQLEPESLAVSDHNHCSVEAVALPAATQRLIATPPGLTHVEANIEWLRQLTEMMEGGSIDLSALGLTGGAVSGGGTSSSASSSPTPSTTTLMQQQKQQQLTATSSLCATTDSNNNPIAAPSVTSHSGTKLDMNIQHTHQQQQSTTFPTSDPYGSSLLNDNANRNISNLAQQQMDTNNFITGAISNRTLEQLTECMNRQGNGSGISGGNGRAVRGIDHHQQYGNATSTNNSNGTSQGSDGNGNNIQQQDGTSQIDRISRALYQQSLLGSVGSGNVGGSIGLDKPQAPPVYLGPPGFTDTATAAQYARSPSPSDSDTSGFGSECSADSAIIDLMNSLNILPTQMNQHVAQQAQQHQNQQHQHVLTASQAAALYNNQQQVINAQLQAAQQQALLQQQLAQQQQQHQSLSSLMSPASGSYLGGGSSDTHAELLRALGLQMTPGGGFVAAGHPTSAPTVHQQQQQHQALHHQHSHQQQHQQQGHRAASIAAAAAAAQSALDTELLLAGEQFYDKHWNNLNSLFSTSNSDPYSIERAAKLYRNAASVCEATCTWSGQFPPRIYKNPIYSPKVFLGGVPWDITEAGLQASFRAFGPMKIEWPGKDGKHPRYPTKAGYVYILFENDKSVKALLQSCTHDFSNGGEYYFKISSRRMRSKEVQVIPWVLSDSNFVRQSSQRLDPSKTVFVGALHGMMNAEGLAHIMNDLFGNVVYAGIDTDKHKYPIGSGRVTFSTHKSYMKAVNAAFVEVKASKFTKKLQIDPYLEDSLCGSCCLNQGPFFCRDMTCFRYYCRTCWQWAHSMDATKHHKPLMRNSRTQQNQSQQSQSQNTPISATQAASLLDVLSPQTATPTHMSLNRQQAAAAAAVVPGSGATTATLGGGNVTPLAGATTAHSHPAAQASPGANIAQPQASLSTMLQQQQQQQQAAQLLAQQQLQQSILSTLGQ